MNDNGAAAPLKVLLVSSEVAPFAKVGGLADVAGALPLALKQLGHDVRVALPCYGSIDAASYGLTTRLEALQVPVGGRRNNAAILDGSLGGQVPAFFVRNDYYFNRPALYNYDDDAERFIMFCRAVLEMLPALDWFPDVIHCNDWQTGIIPNWLATIYRDDARYARIATVLTIHNLAFQGVFPPSVLKLAGLDDRGLLYPQIVPYRDKVDFLGRGIVFADAINTISEQYAREILTPELGENLESLLNERKDRLSGILNAIDTDLFDPASDKNLASNFSSESLDGRAVNKEALQREAGLPESASTPLFGTVERMLEQKGFDILFPALEQLLPRQDAQFILLATGDAQYEQQASRLQELFPDKVRVFLKFDAALAQRIYGGVDVFVMPSRFEPCGLGQMIAMRYGAVPLVRQTGGLADTVQDNKDGTGDGFVFGPYTSYALYRAMMRAIEGYGDRESWRALMRRDMQRDFGWHNSARKYVDLYRSAMAWHTA